MKKDKQIGVDARIDSIITDMIANGYTREEINHLRKAIWAGFTALTTGNDICNSPCRECRLYRPCRALALFIKHLDKIIKEG